VWLWCGIGYFAKFTLLVSQSPHWHQSLELQSLEEEGYYCKHCNTEKKKKKGKRSNLKFCSMDDDG